MIRKSTLIKIHRRFAWVAGIAFMLWALSGLLHIVISWTNPRPVTFAPPALTVAAVPDETVITAQLARHGIERISGLRLLPDGMQVSLPGQAERLYFDHDGHRIADADRTHAIALARNYTGLEKAAVTHASLVTAFSDEYPYINRFLPVWKIGFDAPGNLTAFVETETDRLGTLNDDRKILLQSLFRNIHTWAWLEDAEGLRLVMIAVLVATIPLMAVFGVMMLSLLRGPRRGMRRWHRALAFVIWLPLLMFPLSGLFHLFMTSPVIQAPHEPSGGFLHSAAIPPMPDVIDAAGDIRLVVAPDGRSWWRVGNRDDEALARAMVPAFAPGSEFNIADISLVRAFTAEYGFANKRLPVWRVEFDDPAAPRLFIEPRTSTLAARITPAQAAESWSFRTFHKWQFIDPFFTDRMTGRTVRDGLMVLFILLAVGGVASGLRILLTRRAS